MDWPHRIDPADEPTAVGQPPRSNRRLVRRTAAELMGREPSVPALIALAVLDVAEAIDGLAETVRQMVDRLTERRD